MHLITKQGESPALNQGGKEDENFNLQKQTMCR